MARTSGDLAINCSARPILAFAGFLLLGFSSAAQHHSLCRGWGEGPLSWQEIAEPKTTGVSGLEFYYDMRIDQRTYRANDTLVRRTIAVACMDRTRTWASTLSRSTVSLLYVQTMLDMVESERRALQVGLDTLAPFSHGAVLTRSAGNLERRLTSLREHSDGGTNEREINRWRTLVLEELAARTDREIPAFRKARFSIGANVGFSAHIPFGRLSDLIGPSALNAQYGFLFTYSSWSLLFDGSLGSTHMLVADPRLPEVPSGQRASLAFGHAALGYTLLDSRWWAVCPYLGYGFISVSTKRRDHPDDTEALPTINGGGWVMGVMVDRVLRKCIRRQRGLMKAQGELASTSIRLGLATSPCSLGEGAEGLSIQPSLTLAWLFGVLKPPR